MDTNMNMNSNSLEKLYGAISAEALPYLLMYNYGPNKLLRINSETLTGMVSELEEILGIAPITCEQHTAICTMTKYAWVTALQQLLSDGSLLNSNVQYDLFSLLYDSFDELTAAQIMSLPMPEYTEAEVQREETDE